MPIKFKRKISESGRALRVNIPKEIANYLNIEKGDTVLVYVDNGRMIVEKMKE